MIQVLFICLGNICRSPIAEAVFAEMVATAGKSNEITVDSAGTGNYHVGERPHRGTRQVLSAHNIAYDGRARQLSRADLGTFDYLIALDSTNKSDIEQMLKQTGITKSVYRLLDFAPGVSEANVPDPYYTGNFEHVYQLVTAGCHGLLEHILAQK